MSSNRAIAAEIGVSEPSVRRARRSTASNDAVEEKRVGKDGKARRMPKLKISGHDDEMPTDQEAEESYQETLYDQACWLLGLMTNATRQRFFAHLRRKYHVGK